MKFIKRIWSNEFYQGGIIFTLASFVASFMNYLFNVFAARGLGPSGYGEITTMFSYMAILSTPFLVITTIIIQKVGVADHQLSYAYALEKWFFGKIKKWWFVSIPFLIITPLLPRITNLHPNVAYTIVPMILLSFVGTYYTATFQGLRLFQLIAINSLLSTILKLLGSILVVMGVDGIDTILIFLLLSSIINVWFFYISLSKKFKSKTSQTDTIINKRIKDIFQNKKFLTTAISLFAISLFGNIDVIYVKKFFPPTTAGIYSSWSLLSKIILFAVGPIISLLFIFFTSKKNENEQRRVFYISMVGFALVGVTSFIAYTFFSGIITSILFGNKFIAVIPYFTKASLFGSIYLLVAFLNNYFLAKQSVKSIVLAMGIPIYIGVLFLLPRGISAVMTWNIVFGSIISLVYIGLYTHSLLKKEV
ncbi:MAG: oligosaccharide flippase family protein [bacterium]|nr:oligosaccharide flippase family protein [bacterium]